jgi:hypothetical protein
LLDAKCLNGACTPNACYCAGGCLTQFPYVWAPTMKGRPPLVFVYPFRYGHVVDWAKDQVSVRDGGIVPKDGPWQNRPYQDQVGPMLRIDDPQVGHRLTHARS